MTESYRRLYGQLLEDPEAFEARGDGNALLQEYFNGVPVATLRPLLRHSNDAVRGTAMFVVNELGEMAADLVDDVIPLISDPDPHIQWDALESVMVLSGNRHLEKFVHVVRELENSDSSICRLAMRLVSNASQSQISSAIRVADRLLPNQETHLRGLRVLLNWRLVESREIVELLNDSNDLINKYGAIIAKRRIDESPELIHHATGSENEIVSRFAQEALS